MLFKDSFYRYVLILTLFYSAVILGCRYAAGVPVVLVMVMGLVAAAKRAYGWMTVCYMFVPVLQVINRKLIPDAGLIFLILRFSGLMMSSVVIVTGVHSRFKTFPIGGMIAYLLWAIIASIDGWFPMISFLKIFQFAMMVITLCIVTKQMQSSKKDLQVVRAAMMAISVVLILGSVATYFVPSIGYSMAIRLRQDGFGDVLLTGEDLVRESTGALLFNGMVFHSQALAPIIACAMLWVMCDMLFVEMRISLLHLIQLVVAPVLLYMTHSRTGLLTFVMGIGFTSFFCLNKASIPKRVKKQVIGAFALFVVLLICAAVYFQIKNDMLSRWMRKTDNVGGDERGLIEAITASRQGKVERNMYDFRKNPISGMGFQVIVEHPDMYRAGMISIFSAPLEKGVLPLMVLGETGIVGACIFVFYLGSLFVFCFKYQCMTTATLFVAFLALNMGEASFFSPSGAGGYEWLMATVGGMVVDCMSKMKAYEIRAGRPLFVQ